MMERQGGGMQSGDLVTVRGFYGGPVGTMTPGDPFNRGVTIQPGTPAMVLEVSDIRSRVLMTCGIHWVYNEHMEVTNAVG
jgi:hypothetical protein